MGSRKKKRRSNSIALSCPPTLIKRLSSLMGNTSSYSCVQNVYYTYRIHQETLVHSRVYTDTGSMVTSGKPIDFKKHIKFLMKSVSDLALQKNIC